MSSSFKSKGGKEGRGEREFPFIKMLSSLKREERRFLRERGKSRLTPFRGRNRQEGLLLRGRGARPPVPFWVWLGGRRGPLYTSGFVERKALFFWP